MELKKPIVFFDLETTEKEVDKARIVELSAVKVMPDGSIIKNTKRFNPQVPIDPEATEVHGISDEDVKDAPPFSNSAAKVNDFIRGCDLGGYNILTFDVPILAEELLRCGITPSFDSPETKMIDCCTVFRKMEPRTLEKALEFYCGKKLENAHSAEADTLATYEVFKGQWAKYEELDTVEDFHNINFEGVMMYDMAGKIGIDQNKDFIFIFGKNKGKKVKDNKQYVEWMLRSNFPRDTKDKLRLILG